MALPAPLRWTAGIHHEHAELQFVAVGDIGVGLAGDCECHGADHPAVAFRDPDGGLFVAPGNILNLQHVGVVCALEVACGEIGVPGDTRDGVIVGRDGGADKDLRMHLSMVRAVAGAVSQKGGFRD